MSEQRECLRHHHEIFSCPCVLGFSIPVETQIDVVISAFYCKNHLVIIENGVGKPDFLFYRMKGSDASWEDNNEPPPKCLDYSDDEAERTARRSFQLGERKVKIYTVNTKVLMDQLNELHGAESFLRS